LSELDKIGFKRSKEVTEKSIILSYLTKQRAAISLS